MLRDSVVVVVVVVRTRPRAIPLAMIAIRKILHVFPFPSRDAYGAPLGGPSGRRSSAIITSKAMQILDLIKRNFWFCNEEVKCTLYKSLVRPKLKYASAIWDPHYACDVNKLERVQRCAARFGKGDYRWTASVSAMIEDLNCDSLALRRQQTRLTTMYKISHNLIEVDKAKFINLASEQRTRGTHNFKYFIEHSNKDAHRFSFYPRTIREWNKLPWDVVNASSLPDYKAKLKQYLQD